jgi:phosphatidate cytidylyltransferase
MAAPAEPAKKRSSLQLRIISAAVLIPIVLVALYVGGVVWNLLVAIFGAQMINEWCRISARRPQPEKLRTFRDPLRGIEEDVPTSFVTIGLVLFALYGGAWINWWIGLAVAMLCTALFTTTRNKSATLWFVLGIPYVAVPCAAIIWLRADPTIGLQQIFWIVAMVIAADTGAYIAGRSIGGPKLAPRISPNKTWAGLGGAVVSAAVVGAITAAILGRPSLVPLTAVSAGLAIVEQAGDLAESAFKRHFGVKDASNIIPGHGGALDRVDGLIAVAAAVAGINALIGSSVLTWL